MLGGVQRLWQSLRKPMLFAAYGAAGCLLGAILGEPIWSSKGSTAEPAAPVAGAAAPGQPQEAAKETPPEEEETVFGRMPISRERKIEIQKAIEKGEVEIALTWNNHNDLDLHCIDPSGERIYFTNKQSQSGGALDLDDNFATPYHDEAAEHIRWKKGEAPEGTYKVYVRYYSDHGGENPTAYKVGVKAPGLGGIKFFDGSMSKGDPEKLVYEFDVRPQPSAVASAAPGASPDEPRAPGIPRFWLFMLLIGGYTALEAVGLSLALVIGQNRYQRVRWLSLRQGLIVLFGGCAAGLCAGAVTQGLFALLARVVPSGSIVLQGGRLAGWLVSGAILGRGMGLFIPNLPGKRASMAGGVGGLLAAIAFVALSATLGDRLGRIAGAAILGLFIGLMVALVEELAREAWLVVNWGPHERVNISLGAQPVLIGSGAKAQIHLPRDKGYPPEWAAISLAGGKIEFEDKTSGRKQALKNGSELKIDALTIQVRSAK